MTTKVEKCQRKKVKKIMEEYKEGSLKLKNGKSVKKRVQAVAIALNVARKKCKCKTKTCKH